MAAAFLFPGFQPRALFMNTFSIKHLLADNHPTQPNPTQPGHSRQQFDPAYPTSPIARLSYTTSITVLL
jgi:hypothetical protein